MQQNIHRCIKSVGADNCCIYCKGTCIKYGKTTCGKQRYRCKICSKTFIDEYSNKACITTGAAITALLKEGCGIRSIARLLKISAGTVLKRILHIAKSVIRPVILQGKEYELDELCTFVKKKTRQLWIVYAIRKDTKEVTGFATGCRTGSTLKLVADTLILSGAKKIYTDKLQQHQIFL